MWRRYGDLCLGRTEFSASAEKAKGEGDGTCAICLCEYREAEMSRMMHDCGHSFHLMCIDAWLRLNASCPDYRNSPCRLAIDPAFYSVV